MSIRKLYSDSLSLLTDLYQMTMAYGYFKLGMAERESVFQVTFRRCPFGGEYAIACGLAYAIEFMRDWQFADDDLTYLSTLNGADGKPLFSREFLEYLRTIRFACDVDAVPEGTVVFPHEPLVRIRGPLIQAQILETTLLNLINFQTLIATKSARVCREAGDDPVLEFGLRRAQGIDGGIAASRASFVGGCAATSNILAGKLFGIPVRGTHAHSWVMSFPSEREAFAAYAEGLPNNCVFLVDTYDTLIGVDNAIDVGKTLREKGHKLLGVRLDSGDLTELSRAARRKLDDAGFPDASIVASNDLDEHLIRDLKQQGAKINVWGVGTRLATGYDQPALGGVYKLAAIRDAATNEWQFKVKLSEQLIKVSNPGVQQVRRFDVDGRMECDIIYNEMSSSAPSAQYVNGGGSVRTVAPHATHEDLLVPIFRHGKLIYETPTLPAIRERTTLQLKRLPDSVKRLKNPTPYSVGLELSLHELKAKLVARAKDGKRL